jgi:hypothetical protein
MISSEIVNSLTEDELGMVLHVVNEVFPSSVKVSAKTLMSYKKPSLVAKMKAARGEVKEEFLPIYESCCGKLWPEAPKEVEMREVKPLKA